MIKPDFDSHLCIKDTPPRLSPISLHREAIRLQYLKPAHYVEGSGGAHMYVMTFSQFALKGPVGSVLAALLCSLKLYLQA